MDRLAGTDMSVNRLYRKCGFLVLFLSLVCMGAAEARAADISVMRGVQLDRFPYTVHVILSRRVPYKVVQIDNTEILLALRDTVVPADLPVGGDSGNFIKNIRMEGYSEGVVSLVIVTERTVKKLKTSWLGAGTLVLTLEALSDGTESRGETASQSSQKKQKRVIKKDKPIFRPESGGVTGSQMAVGDSRRARALGEGETFSGTIDDLLLEIRGDACPENEEIKAGLQYCRRGNWESAYNIFARYLQNDTLPTRCLENIYILRAFSFYKNMEKKGGTAHLEAASYFQDFISYFPDSLYAPYAITCMGILSYQMLNLTEAKGYFDIILSEYQDYPGTPEVMYELGLIYSDKKQHRDAIDILTEVVTKFPRGKFVSDAKFQLGKAYFEINDFRGALRVLNPVLKENPRKMYEVPDLLLYIGNAYYHIRNSAKARDVLSRAYNLFPEIESRDIVLTRIGDTYIENNEKGKALKIFQLVVDNYPETDGFVISSMRLAEYLESVEEKEKIYNMVIDDFPDNPLSRLALMRLALLQNKSGQYEKSTETVKKLLETKPRALKKEAVNLFRDASESIFKNQLEKDEYTKLLKRFEDDKGLLDEADSSGLFLLVGKAYLKGHLFDNAARFLTRAYKRTGKSKRSADLVFSLAAALDESGRDDAALKYLREYLDNYPGDKGEAAAHMRMGKIMLEKKGFSTAFSHFRKANLSARSDAMKAESLMHQASALKAMNVPDQAVTALIKAINILAGASEERFDMLFTAHRSLGENHMKLKAYDKAADAFSMAVKFAGPEDNTAEIFYLLGESYRLGGFFDKAAGAYTRVDETGDSFWSSVASQRLRSMKLRTKLEND